MKKNWTGKIDTIIRLIKTWEKRNLSLIGKVHIIKTFLLSQIIYIMQALILQDDVLKTINTFIFKFLWKKKFSNRKVFEKVHRDVLCNGYEIGGLKMINVIDLQHSFIIKWIKCVYCNKDASYSCTPVMYLEKLGYDFSVLRSSVDSKKFMGFDEIKSHFWKKALHVWLKFKDTEKVPINEVDDVANQPLWNNAFVQFKNKSLFYRNWLESGYVCVGDLFIEDSLVSLEHIMTFMGPDPRLPLQYYALYNALPAAWRDPATIGKTPVRIILWCAITKMLIKACFLVQPLEQEGVYQKCCISLCSKVFINHFYQMKASPECLNILTYCSKYWVDRLRRTIGRKV